MLIVHHFMSTYEELKAMSPNDWYPECHNDPNKKVCDHCMNCWETPCSGAHCDRLRRCMCYRTECLCRPSRDHTSNFG